MCVYMAHTPAALFHSGSTVLYIMCASVLTLGIGFTNGTLQVLDASTLTDVVPPFRYSREAVMQIAFSHNSMFMATAVSNPLQCLRLVVVVVLIFSVDA